MPTDPELAAPGESPEVVESRDPREQAEARAAQERRLREGLEASAAVITAGLEASERNESLARMVREIRDRLGWNRLGVFLPDGDGGDLAVAASHGLPSGSERRRVVAGRGIVGHVAVTGKAYLASDTREDRYELESAPEVRCQMAAPLRVAGVVRGVLDVKASEPDRFDETDLAILQRLADQMSLVVHNIELLQAEKDTVERLHELDRLKSRLLTIASHELRTPLTVVMGFAEVLSQHVGAFEIDQVADYADAIVRQARSLSQLVDQMLIAAEIEQGTLSIVPAPVDLGGLVTEVVAGFDGAHIDLGAGLARAQVLADPFRLRQVLENLLSNAVKYASDGVIQLDAKVAGDTLTLLLRDEGPGIPGSEHERVFEAFHQHGEHGVAGRRGVGLGLAVARDLLKLMGGELRLASAEGYGATFLVTLPTV